MNNDDLHYATLSQPHTLSVNGKTYYIRELVGFDFETIQDLSRHFYLVRGWIIGRDVWGYTIVLNTHLKGIYNHYPT